MKITHVRIRALRSRPTGYGHDAAEFEAILEDGDDPAEVAAELRKRCEIEIRHGAEVSRLIDTIDSIRSEVRHAEQRRDGLKKESDELRAAIMSCSKLVDLADREGIEMPAELTNHVLPF